MELSKFLSMCGMLLGFIATIFLSKVLLSNPDRVLQATVHYSSAGWPSKEILNGVASQKADVLSSVILVFLALSLQVFSIFVKSEIQFMKSFGHSILVGVGLIGVLSIVVYYVGVGVKENFELNLKKRASRDYVLLTVEEMSVPLYKDIEAIAGQYFDITKKEETNEEFLKRFSNHVGYRISENADLSKFR